MGWRWRNDVGNGVSVNRALLYMHLDYIIYPLRILNAKSKDIPAYPSILRFRPLNLTVSNFFITALLPLNSL